MSRRRINKLEQQGYTFTGIFERSCRRDIVKERAAELRKAGNKAVMVNVAGGTSVYWIESEQNKLLRDIKAMEMTVRFTSTKIEDLKKELAEAETKYSESIATLQQLRQKKADFA